MKENKAKLIASICKKLEAEGTDEELEYLRELWKSEERKVSGLYCGGENCFGWTSPIPKSVMNSKGIPLYDDYPFMWEK